LKPESLNPDLPHSSLIRVSSFDIRV